MSEYIVEPNVTGCFNPGPGLNSLCLEASERSLVDIGASITGCSPLSIPDSVVDVNSKEDVESSTEAWGLELENQDCAGGGSITVAKSTVYTEYVALLKGSKTPDQLHEDAGNGAAAGLRARKQAELLAQPAKNCRSINCAHDCVPVSSWSERFKFKREILDVKKFGEGTSTEMWIIKVRITTSLTYKLNVACVCPDGGGGDEEI